MTSKLSSQLSRLDTSLDSLLDKLSKIDHATLNKKPDVHSWSVNQVLNHVKLAEYHSLSYCKKKIQAKDLKRAGVSSNFKLGLLKVLFVSPIKFKAPKGVDGPELPSSDNLENIKKEWLENRVHLKEFLENLSAEEEKLAIYKHPVIGRLSFKSTLKFFQAHQDAHERQINSTLKKVDY